MIAWSIEAAIQSGCFDKIIVSTDCEAIAEVARECGAETPFMRPANLSDDHTPTLPVLRHAVETMESLTGEKVSLGCCIYATAPFVAWRSAIVTEGLKPRTCADALDFAFSVTSFPFPIQRALTISEAISESKRIRMVQPEHEIHTFAGLTGVLP